MKLRRLLAALLVFVLVLTSSPVVHATSAEGEGSQTESNVTVENTSTEVSAEEQIAPIADAEYQTISATDTSMVMRSAAVKYTAGASFVERGSTTGYYGDHPRIDTLLTAAVGEFNKASEEWPWIAYKVNVPTAGTYTLGVQTNSCKWANFKLPMVVNGNVYTLTYTAKAQTQTAEVTLPAGEHVVVVFWPMPANESEVYPDADWNSYLWCNIASVVVDSALTASAPATAAEVETVFTPKVEPVDQTIAANNATYVLPSAAVGDNGNGFLEFNSRDAVKADMPHIDTLSSDAIGEFNKAGEEWGWFAYKVTASAAGTYTLGVNINNCRNAPYYIPLCVNGAVHTLSYAATGKQSAAVEVTLPAGDHVVVMFMPMPQNAAGETGQNWVDYPWCNVQSITVDGELTVSKPNVAEVEACFAPPADTVIAANDSTNMLWSAAVADTSGRLEFAQRDAVKADLPYVDSLYEDAIGEFNKSGEEWGWFAYKVTVSAAGTYTLGVNTQDCRNASYIIPLCVNGEVHKLVYSAKGAQTATAEVTLPVGTHTVVMFMPMPANATGIDGQAWVDYPWCNVQSVIVDYKLTASKPTVAEVEACFAPPADTVIAANDSTNMLWSAAVADTSGRLEFAQRDAVKADLPYADSLYVDAVGEFNKTGEEWGWFAYKVTVSAAGTYTLGVNTQDCRNASYIIPLCVNGEVHKLVYSAKGAQTATAEVTLPVGTHTVVMFMPMPANATGIDGQAWVDYPWCNVQSVTVDYKLTASKPTAAEVEACFPKTVVNSPLYGKSALFVGDSITHASFSWASVIGNAYKMDWTNGGISGAAIGDVGTKKIIRHQLMANRNESFDYVIMHGGINDAMQSAPIGKVSNSFNVADFDTETYIGGLETLFYYAYENFPGAKLGYIINYATPNSKYGGSTGGDATKAYYEEAKKVCDKWGIPYIDLYSGKTADGKSYSFDILQVDKVAANFINNDAQEVHISAAGYNLISPYIAEWMETLTVNTDPVPAANSGKHIDANDADKVLSGGFTAKSEYKDGTVNVGLQDRVYTGMAADGANIEMLPYAKDMLGDWAFASIAVNAPADGEYTFKVEMAAKVPYQMGMLVDGGAYTLNYTMANAYYQYMEQTVSLTKGKHYITFTAGMPKNDNEMDGDAWNIYPWTNLASIIVDEGLEVQKAPKLSDVTGQLSAYEPAYTRVEAEDAAYAIYNLTNSKGTPQANAKASGGYLVGDTWNSNITQTYAQVEAWLNSNKQAYIEYAVIAPESGEYDIRVAYQAGASDTSVAKPYIAVVVNGTAYKAQFSKDWNQIDKIKLTVNLQEGLNIIRCTSVTVDQAIYRKGWVNHDFLDLDKRLTPVKHSSAFMEAEDAKYYNKFKVQDGAKDEGATGKVLGASDRKYVIGQNMTLDTFLYGQLKQVPYFSVTVNAPMDGYYPISLKMSIDGRQKNSTLGMVVDGFVHTVKYDKVGKQAKDGEVDTLVYLTEGEHVLTFTAPMPETRGGVVNYSYYWCNFDSITLYDGLTFAKRQKEPIMDPDYTRIEVEDYALFNLCRDNGNAAGNGYYKVSQSVEEIMNDGIDGAKTPYVELTVNAKKAGPYAIFVGVTYGMTQGSIWEIAEGKVVVDVNGKLETKSVWITKTGYSSIIPVWIILEEGENTIRLTHLTSDAQHGGTTWIDFDYIEMPSWVTKGIEFVKPSATLEAEDANYDAFAEQSNKNYSGGAYLGRVNYDAVEELDITHETLNPSDMGGLPHVIYRVFAEKAGTYSLSVGFAAGLTNYPAAEIAEGVQASYSVVVNGETKQRVDFNLKSASSNMSRIITVELKEGENEITVTGTTSEYVIDRKPRNDATYRLVWIDQDYLVLPNGVTGTSQNEEILNIDDSDFGFGQLTTKEKSEQDAADAPVVEVAEAESGFGWIWIVAGIGAAFLMFLILLIGKKRKKAEEKA